MEKNSVSSKKESGRTQGLSATERFKNALPSARGIALAFDEKLFEEGVEPYGLAGSTSPLKKLSREQHAAIALTLDSTTDGNLAAAFRDAQLDPENPWHWKALLSLLMFSIFPAANINTSWISPRYMTLLLAEERLLKKHPEGGQKVKAALMTWYKNETKKTCTLKHIEKLLRLARDPEVNQFLKVVPMIMESAWAGSTERLGLNFVPQISDRLDSETRIKLALRKFESLMKKYSAQAQGPSL